MHFILKFRESSPADSVHASSSVAVSITSWHSKVFKHVSLKSIGKTTSDVPITLDYGERFTVNQFKKWLWKTLRSYFSKKSTARVLVIMFVIKSRKYTPAILLSQRFC